MYANNKTVTIDQTITVNTLRSTANTTPAITAGGKFQVTSATGQTITVTAGHDAANANNGTNLLEIAATSGTLNMVANITGGNNLRDAIRFLTGANCTFNLTGNVIGVATSAGTAAYGIDIVGNAAPTITITGDVTGGFVGTAIQSATTGSPTITINGNVTGGSGTSPVGIIVTGGNGIFTINGNVTGNLRQGIYSTSTGNMQYIINGDLSAGPGSATGGSQGIFYGGGTVSVKGNLVWNTSGVAPWVCSAYGLGPVLTAADTHTMSMPSDADLPWSDGTPQIVLSTNVGSPPPTVGQLWPR